MGLESNPLGTFRVKIRMPVSRRRAVIAQREEELLPNTALEKFTTVIERLFARIPTTEE